MTTPAAARRRPVLAVLVGGMLAGGVLPLAACTGQGPSSASGAATFAPEVVTVSATATAGDGAGRSGPTGTAGAVPTSLAASPTAGGPVGSPSSSPVAYAAPAGPLAGKVIVIDPGHDGGNGRHPSQIARQVDIGNGRKACDTAGAETNRGYPESAFTFDVSTRLAALLRAAGATVVLTRPDDRGVGPCISERAAIGNRAHADAAISVHGDGAPASGYGFHVIVPRGIGSNDAIVAPSRVLGQKVRDAFRTGAGEPLSTYTGTTTGGLVSRSDLGGLNLSSVPKVFIECGNMRNSTDAARMTDPAWRQRAASALATGLTRFVTGS